jgi:hypothetical protein
LLAAHEDDIVTPDRRDFEALVHAAGRQVELIDPLKSPLRRVVEETRAG